MGLHDRAWSGLNIVIFGSTPLLPMRLEQALSNASPGNEVRISSFEAYDQAYDFCKNVKNVGLFLILDNCGEISPNAALKQLALPYESKGWPGLAVLLSENEKALPGYRAISQEKRFIDYLCAEDFLQREKTRSSLETLWAKFSEAFESKVLPSTLQDVLRGIASPILPHETQVFSERLTNIVTKNLNISWIERTSLKWEPLIAIANDLNRKAFESQETLLKIAEISKPDALQHSIFDEIISKAPLVKRVNALIREFSKIKSVGELHVLIQVFTEKNKPGSPALVKAVALNKNDIISAFNSSYFESQQKVA